MYIYKITNKINNKIYIGQTIKNINLRWQRHYTDALSNRVKIQNLRKLSENMEKITL